ncbi:Integrin alpha ina-1 [Toxocara canis]|uniref:Integrin alpha ina-1 n=1 Tax=Toxocara canis TaxID=6265 RepID=A0A0B2ULR5_TOXCA|nr:Integrin alpha ina-1 [Toxocara canis]
MLVSCSQPGLPRTDRHNEFGSCMEGFSGYVDDSLVITGLPGAKKWTGGVFSRYYPKDMFAMNLDRWTMGVEPKAHGIRSKLQAHDYLGYSVRHGRFGFWYEDSENSTIVSGATRYNQRGAVIFLPFKRGYAPGSATSHQLTLTEDSFMLFGTQLGSAFGYAIEVTDLNNDGFDDLLVGAPFEYTENKEGSFGGAVYIYFSSGQQRERSENAKVFLKPLRIRGVGVYSQFGLSITRLGNIDGDSHKYNDFAIGAPFANEGKGEVYIYHGAKSPDELKTEPVQTITVDELAKVYPVKKGARLRTFGFSLSGGVDLDKNGYNDLVVGAFASDAVAILRARPVINIHTKHLETDLKVDIDGDSSCTRDAQTCFYITTDLSVDSSSSRSSHQLLNFDADVFQCTLEVIPLNVGVGTRAKIVASNGEKYIWACGRNANIKSQIRKHHLYIPKKNSDWINPLKLRFSVKIRDDSTPEMPANGGKIVDLNKFPVLNKFGSEHTFNVPFNKKCGSDNICTCDLHLQPVLPGISKEEDGTYVTQVGEKASIDISFVVSNNGERAYEAMLFIEYNSDELDVPVLSKKGGSVNLKDFAIGAPFANEGKGEVYIYHGAKSPDELKTEPVQTITVDELAKVYPVKKGARLRTFGFSLSGGVDLDKNGYNDLVVGAFASDAVAILRARPVINIHTKHLETDLKVDIDGDSSCTRDAQTCFYITTDLSVDSSSSRSSHQLLNFDADVFQCTLEVIPLNVGVGTRAKIVASNGEKYIWACGRNANIKSQIRKHHLYIPKKNSDWINPLKLRFSVKIRDDSTPEMPANGGKIVDLNKFPVLNKFGSEHTFNVPFNKKCGSDNICTCDLHLQPVLPGISKEEDGTYVTQVGEKASIDISFVVSNNGERAYEAMLFIEYNSDELDVPVLSKKGGSVNLKGFSDDLAILLLGNPMEPNKKLKFELSFKLARGRTEGLGKPLEFRAYVNSTSEEKNLDNNDWEAVVRVIKRAELEMTAVSDPAIVSKKGGSVNLKGFSDDLAILLLGNPMEPNKKLKFELSFKLARGRTEGLGKPLEFRAYVNSTSEEKNLDNNDWEAVVRVIKRAELEMTAVSDPAIVRFGGDIKGESAMEFDEDIGPLVLHKYTITNKGPWSVSNVTVQCRFAIAWPQPHQNKTNENGKQQPRPRETPLIGDELNKTMISPAAGQWVAEFNFDPKAKNVEWPYQVASVFTKGKWALYLLETPTIQTTNTDNSNVIKKCSMALPTEWVNPLQLKLFLDSGTSYNLEDDEDLNEPFEEINRRIRRAPREDIPEARPSRELRIKTTKITEKSGEEVEIVRISCAEQSAKCFTVTCHFDFLDVDASALMEFRARLWNATFVEDYYDVTYVEISSSGRLLLDPEQGIEEKDTSNNFASASTHAYPDRPAILETAPIPWWIIAAAVGLGLLILIILILIFWKCGFFKRNRPNHPTLHQAEYQFRQEEWTES